MNGNGQVQIKQGTASHYVKIILLSNLYAYSPTLFDATVPSCHMFKSDAVLVFLAVALTACVGGAVAVIILIFKASAPTTIIANVSTLLEGSVGVIWCPSLAKTG